MNELTERNVLMDMTLYGQIISMSLISTQLSYIKWNTVGIAYVPFSSPHYDVISSGINILIRED
jgi:hypothetical protein